MANQNSGHDPSMEEILASIRRIIVDDDDKAADAKNTLSSDSNDDEDVLELTEAVEESDAAPKPVPKGPSILNITAEPARPATTIHDVSAADDDNDMSGEPNQPDDDAAEETMPNSTESDKDRLVSRQTASSAASALSSLARASDPDPLHGIPKGRPVEALVMEALKPMLSEWLNEHLPAIVERIVEREVRYLARRPQDD